MFVLRQDPGALVGRLKYSSCVTETSDFIALKSLRQVLRVGLQARMFNLDQPRYTEGVTLQMPYPIDGTGTWGYYDKLGLARIYRVECAYPKAKILLVEIC